MIDKSNIEEKLFDLVEGNLSSNEAAEVKSFVEANPEYQLDYDAWHNAKVPNQEFEFKHMDDLLVKERKAPAIWARWSIGGAFLVALGVASMAVSFNSDTEENLSANVEQSGNDQSNSIADKNDETVVKTVEKSSNEEAFYPSNVTATTVSEDKQEKEFVVNTNVNRETILLRNGAQDDAKTFVASNANTNEFNQLKSELNKSVGQYINVVASVKDASLGSFAQDYTLFDAKVKPFKYKYDGFVFVDDKDPNLLLSSVVNSEDNGSFIGHADGLRFNYLIRSEWTTALSDNYISQYVSADVGIDALKGALGIQYYRDVMGHNMINTDAISLIYSPKFKLNVLGTSVSFEPNVKYTFNQKTIDWGQVNGINDIKDPRTGILYGSIAYNEKGATSSSVGYSDFGAGFLIATNKLFVGAAMDHINTPSYRMDNFDQSINIPYRITAHAGTQFKFRKTSKLIFTPNLRIISYGRFSQVWVNNTVHYKNILVGAGVASDKSGLFSLGYIGDGIRLVYGLGLSELPTETGSGSAFGMSHQAGLRFDLKSKK